MDTELALNRIHLNNFVELLRSELKDPRKDNHFRAFHISDFQEFWYLARCSTSVNDYPLELTVDVWMDRFHTFLRAKSEKV